ncbi:MAG: endolytic transglycosylase MltG [Chromatiales bacterium]|nr:endolytic transglycosylase MltG [Chromatiales bacterium]
MRQLLFKLIGLAILLGSLLLGWIGMQYQAFMDQSLVNGEQADLLMVAPGSSLYAIARDLQGRGWIQDARYFVWMARLRGDAQRVRAGEYRVAPGTTPPQLLQQLVQGRVVQHSFTIIEGWSFKEMMQQLRAHEALLHTLEDPAQIMAELGYADLHPEGQFLPETYHFPRGFTDVQLLARAHQALQQVLQQAWETRQPDLPLTSPYETLILASIIERETGLVSEREAIAGVFIRRLQRDMRLQTDPTVIYGMGDGYEGRIRRRDLLTDTPYNTYTRHGLTPTPIAMPSAEAIHAALNPLAGDSLYFVARGDGSHHFSATYEQHREAVRRYQLNRREDYRSSPTPQAQSQP